MQKINLTDKSDALPQTPKISVHHGQLPMPVSLLTKKPQQKKRRWVTITIFVFLVMFIIFGGWALSRAMSLSSKIFVGQKTTFMQKLQNLLSVTTGTQTKLTGEDTGQINVLLLGIGGEGHDGPYLSDTIIVAQIRPETGAVTLVSIPRDYWAQMPDGNYFTKINNAFSAGYTKNHDWNEGGSYARTTVEKISGLTIPYFAVIDFSGFEKAIDQIGGLDIHVDRTFTDYSYPDSGNGYLPPLTFKEGNDHMNGTRALEFARSRHAAGSEGSDFARSLRQQKIIQGFKSKAFGQNLISDAGAINKLLSVFADHFHTNMTPAELYHAYTITKDKNLNILSISLNPETGLICPEILESNGAYVLVPCKSEEDVKNFFQNSYAAARLKTEGSVVWLASSTGNRQAYQTAFRKLTDAGLTVFELSYNKDDLTTTVAYQVNPKPATMEFIHNILNSTEVTLPPPGVHLPKDRVDVVIVLGANAPVEATPKPYLAPPARKSTSTEDSTATTTPASSTTTVPTTTIPKTATNTNSAMKIIH